ncbi:hypothetical protein Tco_0076984 [Tanacetum coccineum]
MDAYRDKYMGDVIVGKPFCRVACVEARRFDGFITIHDDNDSVTYRMACSHPRKFTPISIDKGFLQRSHAGIIHEIMYEKMVEWLTREDVSKHEMD